MVTWKPPRHGPPRSLLRALQRGTGGGYLRALQAPPEQVQAMLLSFAEADPRWDHQVESRTEYWGDLAVEVALPAEPLGEIVLRLDRKDPDGHHDGAHFVALGILGRLAARGRGDARRALIGHVERGVSWDDAIHELDYAGPVVVQQAADALVRRFGPGQGLRTAMAEVGTSSFEDLDGPVGDAARTLRGEHQRSEPSRRTKPNLASLTLEELRAHANDWAVAKDVAQELRRRKTAFSDIAGWLRPVRRKAVWQTPTWMVSRSASVSCRLTTLGLRYFRRCKGGRTRRLSPPVSIG